MLITLVKNFTIYKIAQSISMCLSISFFKNDIFSLVKVVNLIILLIIFLSI